MQSLFGRTVGSLGLLLLLGLTDMQRPLFAQQAGAPDSDAVAEVKQRIFDLAEAFKGQGDPDFSKQRQLEVLVDELLQIAPQPPIRERLDLLYGAWQQIWGPYEYGLGADRGVDPKSDPDRIYQVVFPDGYYYNVAPRDRNETGPTREIVLLRGVYELLADYPDMLQVRFTEYPSTEVSRETETIWRYAALAEADQLDNRSTVVPGLIVRLFFGGGGLREVYTDETLRITFGDGDLDDRSEESIYIMRRVE
ncbi:MAG: hypothetical protein ACTS10_11990 [Kiloniellales bacterium]